MRLLLAACLEPFGADRHDLVGFRIAAVAVPPAEAGDLVVPRAAVIVDGRAWSAAPVDLAWHWVRDPDEVLAIDPLTVADGAGPAPSLTVPDDRAILAVVARRGAEDRRAFVELASPPATIEAPTGFAFETLPLAARTVTAEALAVDLRRGLEGEPTTGVVEPGGFLRLSAVTDGLVRWMATAGTFFELDEQAADWAAAEVVLDDDEVVGRRPLDPGTVTLVALALGEPGEATFAATDLVVGAPGPGVFVGLRRLPTDTAVGYIPFSGDLYIRGTLVADDASPCGLRLVDVTEASSADEGDALDCLVPVDGPFDPDWLLEQRCGRDALVGASVVVRVGLILLVTAALAAEVELHVRAREDGDPIAGALVAAGELGGSTDDRGRLVLRLPDPGPWTLEVTAEGFRGQTVALAGPPGESVRVWLVAGGGPLEIVVEGLKPVADPTRYVVDGEQAEETPGTLDDAVRLAQSLPGVTVQREYSPGSGELSVRGSAPGDSRTFLDGIEIPYLYHYNQYASVFPASQVGELALYPSTFSARYGDSVGAIVDAKSRVTPPEGLHGGGSLNFVMASADASAPVAHGWWLSGSARRSYQDLAGEQTAQYTLWPTFGDWVVRAEHGDEAQGAGVFAFGASDGYTRAAGDLELLDPVEAANTPYLDFGQGFEVLGARGRWSGLRRDGQVSGGLVHHRRRATLTGLGGETLDALSAVSRLDATFRPEGPLGADLGYEVALSRTGLLVDPAGPDGVRVAEEAPALARGAVVDDALLRADGGLYGTAHLTAGALRFMPGLRVAADSAGGGPQLEPRAAVRASVGEQAMLKLAGGRYAQRPPAELLIVDPALPTTSAWQASAGWEQTVSGRLEIALEVYRKWLRDPLELPIDRAPFAAPRGDAVGLELVTRYRIREVVFLWGWLALQQTTLVEEDGARVPADGDQRVSGGLVASWDLHRLNLGARYRFASGLPYTPISASLYDGGSDRWVPILGPTNGARLPAYHKVDLRAAYTFELRGWTLSLVAEVWYVPPSAAQLYPTWSYDYREQGFVVGPTFLPLLGVRVRF